MRAIIAFTFLFCAAKALDCGIHVTSNEALKATINKCINSNKTLEDLWDMTPMSSESDSSSSSEEEPRVDGKMMQSFRTKRSDTKLDAANETDSDNPEPVTENCMIQCIFENLQMTDNTGYPVRTKILEGLLKNATKRELRDFLQDSTDECFQEMDKEATMDPCTYSVKLVTCLAERGKTNCADWPIGDLPLH